MSATSANISRHVVYNGFGEFGPPIEPDIKSSYLSPFPFENFDHQFWHKFMSDYWWLSIVISGIYMLIAYIGNITMQLVRHPFELRKQLFIWNVGLSLFSAVGFLRSFPELWYELTDPITGGFFNSICYADRHNITTCFWGLLFAWSKVLQLGDTAFIILRKQRLIFLHWYRHATVLVYCWYAYPAYDPASRYFCTINYFVHTFMYAFYAAEVCRVKMPQWAPVTITVLQIAQITVGLAVNVSSFFILFDGEPCNRSLENIRFGLFIYFTYFMLFLDYFVTNHLKKWESKPHRD